MTAITSALDGASAATIITSVCFRAVVAAWDYDLETVKLCIGFLLMLIGILSFMPTVPTQ